MTKDEALLMALEAMESVTVECNNFHHPKKDQNHHWAKCPPIVRWDKAITAIKEALAQTQEPVAKVIDWGVEGPRLQGLTNDWPVVGTKLYTTPPQRTWVGLTDEERKNIMIECESTGDWAWELKAAQAIEAKLKQKNGYAEEKNT